MKTTTIDTRCGIHDSETTIRDYGSKICVTRPYTKWTGNSGSLAFAKQTHTSQRDLAAIRRLAAGNCLALANGDCIDDL